MPKLNSYANVLTNVFSNSTFTFLDNFNFKYITLLFKLDFMLQQLAVTRTVRTSSPTENLSNPLSL
jgi:hypothetical protein